MTFCPEWLTGSPNLNTSNMLFLWVYLVVSFIPLPFKYLTRINLFFGAGVHEHDVCPVLSHPTFVAADRGRSSSWVVIPMWLMYDSYTHIAGTLRSAQAGKAHKIK